MPYVAVCVCVDNGMARVNVGAVDLYGPEQAECDIRTKIGKARRSDEKRGKEHEHCN